MNFRFGGLNSLVSGAEDERITARKMLALVMALLLGLLGLEMLASAAGRGSAIAQQSTPPPPTIKLLNPDNDTSGTNNGNPLESAPEISTKQDVDNAYHLVAWVNQVPANAVVEFKYDPGDITICTGTRVGTSDTFECFWSGEGTQPPIPEDGEYTLRVILYSGNTAVAEDAETVNVNNAGEEPEEHQANTVEIVYPLNAGPLGYYRPPAGGTSNFLIQVVASEGTLEVTGFYSTSAPGTEPVFVECDNGAQELNDQDTAQPGVQDTIRCDVAEGDDPAAITAVAARAEDENAVGFPDSDSSDAHRVAPYEQIPTTITLANGTQDNQTAGTCSQPITARVFDQTGRPIAGVNLDVHAAGPDDQLRFDDADDGEHQAPNSGGHSQVEDTEDCESDTHPAAGDTQQGEHEVPGPGDIKHIESIEGSNQYGDLTFRLFSASAGITQYTVWADEDDDDEFCSAEANASGAIGWGQAAGTVTGVPATKTACPRPTRTGTPTQSPTRTQTSPARAQRRVTLAAGRSRVTAGQNVGLSGQIESTNNECEDLEQVTIERRGHDSTRYEVVRNVFTDELGFYRATVRVRENSDFRARVANTSQCAAATSNPDTVLARVRVSIKVSDLRPARGQRIRIFGQVNPQHDRTRVVLLRKRGGRWVGVARDRLNRRSRYSFRFRARWTGTRVFRVRWPSQDRNHVMGQSNRRWIRTH